MAALASPIKLESEEDAWRALRQLLDNSITAEDIDWTGSSFAWAKLEINAKGEAFHSSMPASFMRGLVEFQDAFIRTAALILKDDPNIGKLDNSIKAELDLTFQISEGSTEILAELKEQLGNLTTRCVEKMSGRGIAIVLLTALLTWGGTQMYANYLQNNLSVETLRKAAEKDAAQQATLDKVLQSQSDTVKALLEAAAAEKKARQVQAIGDQAKDALFRNSAEVDQLEVQGIPLTRENVTEINRRTRRKAEEVDVSEMATVVAIDAAEAHHFKVKLTLANGASVTCLIRDVSENERTLNTLMRAEVKRTKIMVKLKGRKFGKELRDVSLIKAWTPRKVG